MEPTKIQVGQYVREMEAVMRHDGDPIRCAQALAVLQRWQFDDMLDDASRETARALVTEFAGKARWVESAGSEPKSLADVLRS